MVHQANVVYEELHERSLASWIDERVVCEGDFVVDWFCNADIDDGHFVGAWKESVDPRVRFAPDVGTIDAVDGATCQRVDDAEVLVRRLVNAECTGHSKKLI